MYRTPGPLDIELAGEMATSLGVSGRRLRTKLDALRRFDSSAAQGSSEAIRQRLVDDATEALWGYAIQRELMGLTDAEYIAREYAVPREVWIRQGCRRRA
jgi:hypothetical protein